MVEILKCGRRGQWPVLIVTIRYDTGRSMTIQMTSTINPCGLT